ncbi:hypothetical protein [Candidatus Halobonum tyrrellensis]|uniref:DUF8116 domain-containing protein n=1 Tax=Candidatus Halobonum tyrrellensis G22 TaxID=1324957 RepID=V4IY56_9EURY|nr:hypothetical protein [Candidatus Halobonum tyrrellensis]ESP88092.1 hypothetical protein K933_10392 [Candidatus Halobonum tyrrellensis G22]
MTLLRLLACRTPADFAEWYRAGAEYTLRVAEGMGFDAAGLRAARDDGYAALRAERTDVAPDLARTVAATLLGDAEFGPPFLPWTPTWYRAALTGPVHLAARRLRRAARPYADAAGGVPSPAFSRPADVLVDGAPPTAGVSGFHDRFLLADAVIHVEWFAHVAREAGVDVPASLVDRTRRVSAAYYGGRRETLPPDVRRFQRHLFADDAWVRDVDTSYRLDSTLFSVWERTLRAERERLTRATRSPGADGRED